LFTGPSGEALFILIGEGHKYDFSKFVKTAINYYKDNEQLLYHSLPISPTLHILPQKELLLFPGKVACSDIHVQDAVVAHNIAVNDNDMSSVTSRHQESVNNNTSEDSNSLDISQDDRLAVSDTGHHRIIVFHTSGRIEVKAALSAYLFVRVRIMILMLFIYHIIMASCFRLTK
jgi:hypothetical protein